MKVFYHRINLPFRYPFTISRGTKTHQPSLIVKLSLGPYEGFGEAPAIGYYDITVEKMIQDLESKKNFVEKFAFTTPERYWHYLHHLFPKNPFLVCALDMAAWDLYGKLNGKSLRTLWNTPADSGVFTDYTIGIDTIETMVSKMREKPWPVYKIKVGAPNDVEMVRELRRNTDAILRLDANAGWTTDEALLKLPLLAELGVEMVEQPLHKDNWEGMEILQKMSPVPLYADESCVFEHDVEKCSKYFNGINIKLTKCSGITPARRMIEKARSLGLKVMMGSMNESTIGSSAIAHFMPLLDLVDVDGPLLLAEDVADGLRYDNGKVSVSDNHGLGFLMNFKF